MVKELWVSIIHNENSMGIPRARGSPGLTIGTEVLILQAPKPPPNKEARSRSSLKWSGLASCGPSILAPTHQTWGLLTKSEEMQTSKEVTPWVMASRKDTTFGISRKRWRKDPSPPPQLGRCLLSGSHSFTFFSMCDMVRIVTSSFRNLFSPALPLIAW